MPLVTDTAAATTTNATTATPGSGTGSPGSTGSTGDTGSTKPTIEAALSTDTTRSTDDGAGVGQNSTDAPRAAGTDGNAGSSEAAEEKVPMSVIYKVLVLIVDVVKVPLLTMRRVVAASEDMHVLRTITRYCLDTLLLLGIAYLSWPVVAGRSQIRMPFLLFPNGLQAKSGFQMLLWCLGPSALNAGAKTRLHTPKAVTYHEQHHITVDS